MKTKKNHPPSNHVFSDELLPGERILWIGQPDASKIFTLADFYLIPFSLGWGGFALFWNIGVWQESGFGFFQLWGLPFLAFGIYMVIGRFFYKRWAKKRTFYGITDKRLLILTTFFNYRVEAYSVHELQELRKYSGFRDTGSITFGAIQSNRWVKGSRQNMANTGLGFWGAVFPGFYDIPEVSRVYALINRLRFPELDPFVKE